MTLLSIITINLNNKVGLEKTFTSIFNQSFRGFELIVIDGASVDGSIELIEKYSNQICYWATEPDSGVYEAMNKGIREASGEYCYFLNSGDVFFNKEVLESVYKLNIQADIVTGNAVVDGIDKKQKIVNAPQNISFFTFYNHTILHQATLIRTSLFTKTGLYNENLKIVSDWEFFVRALFLDHCTYQSINVIISLFDDTGISSQQKNSLLIFREREEVLRKYFPYFADDYKLLHPRSVFIFLKHIQNSRFLKGSFIFLCRLFNLFNRFFSS
jgi:glycosyltransferase involved in cell wall biosynthesis